MGRVQIGAASREQEAVDVGQQGSSGAPIGDERQYHRNAAELFNGSYVSSPQEVGGLSSAHIFAVTGIEVRCYPDDWSHIIESVPMAGEPVLEQRCPLHAPVQPARRGIVRACLPLNARG